MLWSLLMPKLVFRDISVSFDNVLDVAKASSGGQRDVNFLNFLWTANFLYRKKLFLPERLQTLKKKHTCKNTKKCGMKAQDTICAEQY